MIEDKRQRMTNKIRQEHRNQIFESRRKYKPIHQTFPLLQQLETSNKASQPVLSTLPPYIQTLSDQQMVKCLELCRKCIWEGVLLEQATACLIQITNRKNLREQVKEYLQNNVYRKVWKLLESTKNTEIIINCVYIFGNCEHTKSLSKVQKCELIKQILAKLTHLCANYPFFLNILQLMVWYLRGIILLHLDQQFHQYTLNISKQIIITISSKILSLQQKGKYLQIMGESFQLIWAVVDDIEYEGNQRWIYDVDESIAVVLNNDLVQSNVFIMNNICQILLTMMHKQNMINSLIPFAMIASSQKIRCQNSLVVCSKLIDLSKIPFHLKENIALNIILNAKSILVSEEIVLLRNYRIGFVDCLLSIFYTISIDLAPLYQQQTLTKLINMMELVFIDKDNDSIVKGLKLLQMIGDNQTSTNQILKQIIINMSLDRQIIQLQDHTNPEVYDAATDLLDLLSIQS